MHARVYSEHRKPTQNMYLIVGSVSYVCVSMDKTWNKSKSTALGRIFHLTVTKSTKHLYSFKTNKFFVSSHIHVAEAAECWFSLTIYLTLSLLLYVSENVHYTAGCCSSGEQNRSTYSIKYIYKSWLWKREKINVYEKESEIAKNWKKKIGFHKALQMKTGKASLLKMEAATAAIEPKKNL